MGLLRAEGVEISHDWTREVVAHQDRPASDEELRCYATLDYDGVAEADVLLALTPPYKDWGCALWTELGIALAMGKMCLVTGPLRDRNIFAHLCFRYETDDEAIAVLREIV